MRTITALVPDAKGYLKRHLLPEYTPPKTDCFKQSLFWILCQLRCKNLNELYLWTVHNSVAYVLVMVVLDPRADTDKMGRLKGFFF